MTTEHEVGAVRLSARLRGVSPPVTRRQPRELVMKERFLVPHLKRYGFRFGLFERPTRLGYPLQQSATLPKSPDVVVSWSRRICGLGGGSVVIGALLLTLA